MRAFSTLTAVIAAFSMPLLAQQTAPPYKDPHLSIEDRVADLLSRTTLEEKVAQISDGGEGDEVPQLYIHQTVSSVTRPVLALRGFQRVHLRPGEKTTASFVLTPENLALWNEEMKFVVEAGIFDILVGTSSSNTQATQLEVIAKQGISRASALGQARIEKGKTSVNHEQRCSLRVSRTPTEGFK